MKAIPGYEGLYGVTRDGKIWSCRQHKFMKTKVNNKGYEQITLTAADHVPIRYLVHRLVAEVYCPKREDSKIVDHINGNKTDNRAENLRWVTNSENLQSHRPDIKRPHTFIRCKETGRVFESIGAAARWVGCHMATMSQHINGKSKTVRGMHFERVIESD